MPENDDTYLHRVWWCMFLGGTGGTFWHQGVGDYVCDWAGRQGHLEEGVGTLRGQDRWVAREHQHQWVQ